MHPNLIRSLETNRIYYNRVFAAMRIKSGTFDFASAIASGRTLLVGEGNFSFTASLINMARIVPGYLITTAFEHQRVLSSQTEENVQRLRRRGVRVIFGVDATNLAAAFG